MFYMISEEDLNAFDKCFKSISPLVLKQQMKKLKTETHEHYTITKRICIEIRFTREQAIKQLKDYVLEMMESYFNGDIPTPLIPEILNKKEIGELTDRELGKAMDEIGLLDMIAGSVEFDIKTEFIKIYIGVEEF